MRKTVQLKISTTCLIFMMESLLMTWSQSFKLEEHSRNPRGWGTERVKFDVKKEVRCTAQFAVWHHEPGSLQSTGQNLRAGSPGGRWNAGMKEEAPVMTWLYILLDTTPHNQPGFLEVSPGRQGSREVGG